MTERPKGMSLSFSRKIFIFVLVEFSSKDIKQDLSRLLVKSKDDDTDEKFEIKIAVMR